jgi:hypothetical protein
MQNPVPNALLNELSANDRSAFFLGQDQVIGFDGADRVAVLGEGEFDGRQGVTGFEPADFGLADSVKFGLSGVTEHTVTPNSPKSASMLLPHARSLQLFSAALRARKLLVSRTLTSW